MKNNQYKHAVGAFATKEEAEAALRELRDAGFNMDKVSVIARNAEVEENLGGAEVKTTNEPTKGGAKLGATAGATTGGIFALVGSLGVLTIPGLGTATEVGTVLANTLLGGGIGAVGGSLLGALIGWGIPEDVANYYNELFSQGHYLVLVEGTEAEVNGAEAILQRRNLLHWGVYAAPMADTF